MRSVKKYFEANLKLLILIIVVLTGCSIGELPTLKATPLSTTVRDFTSTTIFTATPFPSPASPSLLISTVEPTLQAETEFAGLEWLNQIGGPITAVAVQRNRVFIGRGPRLAVLDVTKPAQPQLAGQSQPLPALITQIEVAGQYLYVAAAGLSIFDINDPTSPTQLGRYIQQDAAKFTLDGDYAYIPGQTDLYIVDVTDPRQPAEIGRYRSSNPVFDVAVKGAYAYLTSAEQIQIINIADPTRPVEINTYQVPIGEARGITIQNDLAYVNVIEPSAKPLPRFHILDLSNPRQPAEVGVSDYGGDILTLAGRYAYVGIHTTLGTMAVMDFSNPISPTGVANYGSPTVPADVAVNGNYAYVAYGAQGLHILDMTDPIQPQQVGRFDELSFSADNIDVAGNFAYVINQYLGPKLWAIDIADPQQPSIIGTYDERELPPFSQMAVAGNHLYLLSTDLQIMDLSNPGQLTTVGVYPSRVRESKTESGAILGMAIVAPYAYLAEGGCQLDQAGLPTTCRGGLRVLDLSTPDNPLEVGYAELPDARALAVTVVGDQAYVVAEEKGLQIFDVSQPASPMSVGFHPIQTYFNRFEIWQSYAYIFTYPGLLILNLTEPASPVEVGVFTSPCYNNGPTAALIGNRAYMAGFADRDLCVIDVSELANPKEIGFYELPGHTVSDVTALEDKLFVANEDGGLWILQPTDK